MSSPESSLSDFDALLEHIRGTRGFDFTGYKQASLQRRIQKRMHMVGVQSYADYFDYLQVHPEEFGYLFNVILINVTGFFRDPQTWEYLQQEIVPRIVAGKRSDQPIRLWVAGCASGEEAYSLASIMAEALGIDAFRERVKIYATDVDQEALDQARSATYSAKDVESIPQEYLQKYFESNNDGHFIFHNQLRRSVIFGRHDLIQDAPISRLSLIVCRNTLMYLNSETQDRILDRFYFALEDGGFLFLGKAETLLTHHQSFQAVDLQRRVFVKSTASGNEQRPMSFAPRAQSSNDGAPAGLCEAAFETDTAAQLVVDPRGAVTLANERARTLFGITAADLGRSLQDLEIYRRPVELGSPISRAQADRQIVTLKGINHTTPSGESVTLEALIMPLTDRRGTRLGLAITYRDFTAVQRLEVELRRINQDLETTSEELQASNEELETTNEELGSTVEELETTNEELQSTNEELETMNEELQSTNEELQAVNDQLCQRGGVVDRLNRFLERILTSLHEGVAVMDYDLRIQAWNRKAEDLWGLRSDEVLGKHLLNLDIGLPLDQLKQPLRACMNSSTDSAEVVLDTTNRRGKAVRVRFTCLPLNNADKVEGAILLMDDMHIG